MITNRIINSKLDTDLYKISQMAAVLQKFPNLEVEYAFIDRNNTAYPAGFAEELRNQVEYMEELELSKEEESFLRSISYIPAAAVDFLKGFHFDSKCLDIEQDEEGYLSIRIKGYWHSIILWEVPLLAIISELYYKISSITSPFSKKDICTSNIIKFNKLYKSKVNFSEFGTRRRFSFENQETLLRNNSVINYSNFVGTSNVLLALKYGLKPIGTMAHEWIMAHGALYGYRMANKMALDNWADVYGGNLGIALSDTYTIDSFLRSFDTRLAKLFDGVRQDSGDPYLFADKIIAHYKNLGIDPMSKTIIFSDALDVDKAISIRNYCEEKIKCSFGIGTHLTNDLGVKPMNIVIKLSSVMVNKEPVPAIKLSDDKGKNTGDKLEIELCKGILRIL